MMETQTIPAERWISYFDEFSKEHEGWPVTIEVMDRESGHFKVAENQPLVGISFGQKGTRPSAVEIGVGDGTHHVVDLPIHIMEAKEPNGDIDLEFEPSE